MDLSQQRLKELLDYDPETGNFIRRCDLRRHKKGTVSGAKLANGYISVQVDGVVYLGHRLAWFYAHGEWPKHQIDHINGVRSDNRMCNLREATNQQNCQNKTRTGNGVSGLRGVSYDKRQSKWRARIVVNNKEIWLGQFVTLEEAEAARNAGVEKYFEFHAR